MNDKLVGLEFPEPGLAILSLQRAEKRNALNIALLEQLIGAMEQLAQHADSRVIILRGEGSVFCAGLDLIEANNPDVAERSAEGVRRVLSLLRESPLIVIGAAVGAAYAGGAGLLAACDLVVAADDFHLGFPEVRRGLVAAMVSNVLVRKISVGALSELLLLGEPITAERARQMGLIQWIVPSGQVLESSLNVARKILAGGPQAVRETKQLINREPATFDLESLQALHERIRHSAEAREGFAAFLDRREPNWCQKS